MSVLRAQRTPGCHRRNDPVTALASGLKAKVVVFGGKMDHRCIWKTNTESAWASAESAGEFVFTWWNEGDAGQQPTEACKLWDDQYLYVSFNCTDKNIQATRVERDSQVYRDECVEVFASPEIDHPECYFNLEMNALGAQLDGYRPSGADGEPIDWNPVGIKVAVSLDATINDDSDVDRGWSLEVAIPFRLCSHVLPAGRPQAGDRWRLNLNRLDRTVLVKSQWSQGDRSFPRYLHPEFFGFVEFSGANE